MSRRTILLLLAVFSAGVNSTAAEEKPGLPLEPSATWVSGSNLVQPAGLPQLGKWMLGSDGAAAHWLGEIYDGKRLREPINVIIVDE